MPIGIKTFDPNQEALEELALIMQKSWFEEYEGKVVYDYSPEFLRWCLAVPTQDDKYRDLTIGAYDNRLVGFIASLPRRIKYRGENLDTVLMTFWTAEKKDPAILVRLLKELESRYNSKGIDSAFLYLDRQDTHTSSKVIGYINKRRKLAIDIDHEIRIATMDLQNLESKNDKRVRAYTPSDNEQCLNLLNNYSKDIPLARVWERAELDWQLNEKPASTAVFEEDSQIKGLINYYSIGLWQPDRKTKLRIAYADNVHLAGLNKGQKQALVNFTLGKIKQNGFNAVWFPDLGYFDLGPFRSNGLDHYKLNLFSVRFSQKTLRLNKDEPFYLDVK